MKTVVTVDAFFDGDDLQWTVKQGDGSMVTLTSGEFEFAIRNEDLQLLAQHVRSNPLYQTPR